MSTEAMQFLAQLRAMKYGDSLDFRHMCVEYASANGMTVDEAIAILKPICDSRERGL